MFGKWFDTAYTGSMAGAGADVFAVWTYAVAHAINGGSVELNPLVIASLIGMPVENVNRAIEFLEQPDPKSRNPEHEGRRLLFQSGHRYRVVSQPIYRKLEEKENRREYLRLKQQERRETVRLSTNVLTCQQMSTDVNSTRKKESNKERKNISVSTKNVDTSSSPPLAGASAEGLLFPDERTPGQKSRQKKIDKKIRDQAPTKTDFAKARHKDFKLAIFLYFQSKNDGADPSWGPMEGEQLEIWLRANPKIELPQFTQMLRHRYRSEVNHAERPALWIKNITSFSNGRLDRFGKPLDLPPQGEKNGRLTNSQAREAQTVAAFEQVRSELCAVDSGPTGRDRPADGGGSHPRTPAPHHAGTAER